MPRLIVLLLVSAALTTLTLQNRGEDSAVPLVVAGQTVIESMPLGLLLLLSVAAGSLLTLVLYGLVGIGKPPENKYRPMGRRVPYPDAPGGSSSVPSTPEPGAGFTPQDSATSSYGSSSAFVSEPTSGASNPRSPSRTVGQPSEPASAPDTNPQPFITPPPQDTPPSSSPTDQYQDQYQDGYSAPDDDFAEPPNSYFRSDSRSGFSSSDSSRSDPSHSDPSHSDPSYSEPLYSDSSYLDSEYSETRPTRSDRSNSSKNRFIQQPIAGLKSVFGKKKDRDETADVANRPVGEDWGELRTTEQRNSWNVDKETSINLEEGAKSLFRFGRDVGANASRLAEDIAGGWNDRRSDERATGHNGRPYEQYSADHYADSYSDAGGLDQGWQSPDDYPDGSYPDGGYPDGDREPSAYDVADKRTYGDSLYGSSSADLDGAYPADDFDDGLDDVGPDDVYEADYRVIEPPKKPLSEIEPTDADSEYRD
ncbi:MAG: hypothetical protein AAFZ17_11935 [Cyanobacteria bacterium J06650_10]